MSQPIDTNVSHYTIADLLTILDIKNDAVTEKGVTEKTRVYLDKFKKEKNDTMLNFFTDIENRLLDYVDEVESGNNTAGTTQSDEWFQKNSLSQKDNPTQDNKITDRKQKIKVFNDSLHLPMKQQQLGITNTVSVPVSQDILNPTLKNTITRMINLDSQFRQTSAGSTDISTDYTLDLSEPLLNVLSLKLHAFMIPYTWYTIDVFYGNNCMWITFLDGPSITITITPGNYSPATFQDEVRNSFIKNGFTFPDSSGNIYPISINTANALVTLNLLGGTYRNSITGSILNRIDETTVVTFFDPTRELSCFNNVSCNRVTSVNQTLGWIMGFRVINYSVAPEGNTAVGIMNLYGPKYLIIVLDDFNQNHINNGLIGITELSSSLKLPSYFSPDLLYTCNNTQPLGTNLDTLNADLSDDPNAGNLIIDKMNINYKSIPQVIPRAPRKLTQSQIYSINEIMKNNGKSTSLRGAAPTVPNTFALIPIKHVGMRLGDVYVESNGSLQDNKRVYFGPVNIERMRIKLLDDKGNILNLNGGDWTITLISENLYQY